MQFALCIVTPTAVYVDTLRSFAGVPTHHYDTTLETTFACYIPASHLTDGVLGESSPANFSQFSAWNRLTGTDKPRIFFQFSDPGTNPPSFFIRQIDLYFYKSAALRVGLPDVRFDIASSAATLQADYRGVPYTIVSNQSISECENQTVKVSLVNTLEQNLSVIGYPNNVIVRLTFDFSSSDTLDWILLSEVSMFNDTGEYSLLAQ